MEHPGERDQQEWEHVGDEKCDDEDCSFRVIIGQLFNGHNPIHMVNQGGQNKGQTDESLADGEQPIE